jgi:PPOX class probable F420-dependent enzyme
VADVLSTRARSFLERQRVGRLATADRAGVPHVVPFCFAPFGEALYFVIDAKPKRATGTALKRMRNIAENPAVAVVVDEYDEDWSSLAYLLLRGHAAVVSDDAERRRALAALRLRYPQYRTMDLEGPAHPIVRIEIRHAHFWSAK